jgi:hypothetical protein
VHAQWWRAREIILGKGNGYCMLPSQSITSSTLDDMTPHEVWTSKKPSHTYLKVFGCEAYVHVPKENRSNVSQNQLNEFDALNHQSEFVNL